MSGGIPPPVNPGIHSRAFRLAALTLIFALGLLALPSTSSAQGVVTRVGPMEIPFDGLHPCTGEPFAGTSRFMLLLYPIRTDGSGGAHAALRVLIHSQATALALNPRKYQSNHEEGAELNAPSSGTLEATQTVNQVLVRQGEDQSSTIPLANDDDFLLKQTFHMTFNSNGILTADVLNGHETACAGPPLGPAAIVVP